MIAGYCAICHAPITVFHAQAGAITQSCGHPSTFVLWMATLLDEANAANAAKHSEGSKNGT